MSVEILRCDTSSTREAGAKSAAECLARGGVVIFPTETVYGIGACAGNREAMARLRRAKGREDGRPFTVHLGHPEATWRYVDRENSPVLRRLVQRAMPGPITLLAEASPAIAESRTRATGLAPEAMAELYHEGTIGLRCPDHPLAAALLGGVAGPVVASSANPAGAPPPRDAEGAAEALGEAADLVLDGGPTRFSQASTVVRVRRDEAEVVREGVYDHAAVQRLVQVTVLFVCTGNTCRSPMAEAIARAEVGDGAPVQFLSAGVKAVPGGSVSPHAAEALRQMGITPQRHRAQRLTRAVVRQADAIYCMSDTHRQAALSLVESDTAKVKLLDAAAPVADPIGESLETYVECSRRIQQLVRRRLAELDVPMPVPPFGGPP